MGGVAPSSYLDVEGRVSGGDTIRVRFPDAHGSEVLELTGAVTSISEGNSVTFRGDGGTFVLRRYGHREYHDAGENIRVLKDLNAGGAAHLRGLNGQGDPAEVEILGGD